LLLKNSFNFRRNIIVFDGAPNSTELDRILGAGMGWVRA